MVGNNLLRVIEFILTLLAIIPSGWLVKEFYQELGSNVGMEKRINRILLTAFALLFVMALFSGTLNFLQLIGVSQSAIGSGAFQLRNLVAVTSIAVISWAFALVRIKSK